MPYRSVNPATGEVLASFADHSDDDIQSMLTVAHNLYKSGWSQGPVQPRLSILERLASLIEDRADALALILANEMGKRMVEARWEVDMTAAIARYYAQYAAQFLASHPLKTDRGEAWIEYRPIGVIVAVEPWNFPYYQLARIAAPNLAIGNPVLAKHASIVPQAAIAFEELLTAAGAPRGAWTNMFASAQQIGSLIEDERVQGVTLTGSEKAGSIVAAQAGKNIKKSVLELGGADVFIVLDDADLDRAVELGAQARLNVAGQACNAAKRFVVHHRIADAFLSRFTARFAAVKVGDPLDPATDMGPLSSVAARDEIAAQVMRAVTAGATLHFGGNRIERPGAFYQPTILTDISRDNPAYFEEFFGPVAQVYVVADDDCVVDLANDSHFGLSASIFTADVDRAKRLAARIETGSVWVNARSSTAPELPFGGVKKSGYGRELGEFGIREFVNPKMIVVEQA